ncbi:MAG: VOC family protein [Nitrospirae bacterium]|nr:VOC family protein [Nitrospirota bacterium]
MAKMITDSWVVAESGNIPRAVRFYAKLGIKPSVRMSSYVELPAPGGTAIGFYTLGHRKVRKQAGGWQIMFRVNHIEKLRAALKRKGVRTSPIERAPGESKLSWCTDPDGNRLTLMEFGKRGT